MARVPRRDFSYVSKNPEKDLRLQILVCGKTGTGKSTLINSVIGRKVCKSGGPGSGDRTDNEALEPVTKAVHAIHSNSNGIIITVWDSPGLQDGTSMEKVYLQDMYDKCKNVDLVYYCIDMTTSRWTLRDENALGLMAEKFDATFWSKCILVLTKANTVRVPPAKRKDKKAYFEQLYNNFIKQFQKQLQAHNVPKDVSTGIPASCAGIIDGEDQGPGTPSHNDRYLYYTSNHGDYSDGERKHFLSELWLIGFQRIPIESRLKYKQATGDRERFAKDVFRIIEEMCESKGEDEVKANHTSESQNKSEDEVEDAEKKNKAQYQEVTVEREDAEKSQSTRSQNKSEDEIEHAEKISSENQNKREDKIEDAEKYQSGGRQSKSGDEIENAQGGETQNKSEDEVEDAEKKNKVFNAKYQDVPVESEVAEESQSSESQNTSKDEIEDAEKYQSSESKNTRDDQKEDAEEKNEVLYQDVPRAEPIKGTDLPMDDSQKNRLKKISVRKNVKRGAIIGGIAGSVLPIAGSLVGAAVGAGVGAVIAKAKKKSIVNNYFCMK